MANDSIDVATHRIAGRFLRALDQSLRAKKQADLIEQEVLHLAESIGEATVSRWKWRVKARVRAAQVKAEKAWRGVYLAEQKVREAAKGMGHQPVFAFLLSGDQINRAAEHLAKKSEDYLQAMNELYQVMIDVTRP